MSTSNNAPLTPFAKVRDMRVAVVRTLWNSHITEALMAGALDEFKRAGLGKDDVDLFPLLLSKLIETGLYDAIVVLGCVIRGGTPHFDYVCQSVTQGITHLNSECDIPVIFGILTVDNEQQALDRIGGPAGHKGIEAAQAALLMYDFSDKVENI